MGSWDSTVPTFPVQSVRAADLQTLADIVTALTASWTTYAPTWSSATGSPSIGNGTITAGYRQVGKTVDYSGQLIIGSTTTVAGTGQWRMSMPVPASATFPVHVGSCWIFSPVYAGTCQINSTTILEFTATDSAITGTTPYIMGTGDQMRWSITYEAA
jgi:hypothetical protein